MSHRLLLDVPDPLRSFCSCATPPGGLLFGLLAESSPLTGYEPKTCIDVSSGHTPINYLRGETASTSSTTTLPPQSQPPKTPMVFSSQRQPAAAPSKHHSSVVNPWLSADMWSSTRKLVRCNESIASVGGTLSRKKKETEIWKECKLCPKGEISMSILNRKLNWLFKENAELRKDYVRLRQKWTWEIENEEMLIYPSMKPIENSNLKDWSCIRRINGQIRLREKRLIYVENWKWETESSKKVAQKNCQEIEESWRICREEREPDNWE